MQASARKPRAISVPPFRAMPATGGTGPRPAQRCLSNTPKRVLVGQVGHDQRFAKFNRYLADRVWRSLRTLQRGRAHVSPEISRSRECELAADLRRLRTQLTFRPERDNKIVEKELEKRKEYRFPGVSAPMMELA